MYAFLALTGEADFHSINSNAILLMILACLEAKDQDEDDLHKVCLNLLKNLLKKAARARELETLAAQFELIGGLDCLESLQYSPSNMVYQKALHIIERYYGVANCSIFAQL